MRRYRTPIIAAALGGALVGWTLIASLAYAIIAHVPYHCWFYYAVPWPEGWWDQTCLVLSGTLASLPFFLVGKLLFKQRARIGIYGKTDWATERERKAAGISSSRKPV